MSKPRGKFMDVLAAGLSGDDSDSDKASGREASGSEEDEAEAGEQQQQQQQTKRGRKEITVEDLQRAGYNSGPSLMYMKAPQEEVTVDWQWSSGKDAKKREDGSEDEEERAATRAAVTKGVTESAEHALRAKAYAAKLRDDSLAERQRLAQEKRLTFNQKEKRKRDTGQTSRDKSTVEESKRQAREFGMYSGFD